MIGPKAGKSLTGYAAASWNPARPVLTTQIHFPDEPTNRRDGLFRRDLAMRITEAPDGLAARFDFVLDMR
jgi:hypothetical protein